MNSSHPTSDVGFAPSVEVFLLILGGILTLAVVGVAIWLVRVMRREDRERQHDDSDRGGA